MAGKIFQGDALKRIKELPDNSMDIIHCDPPYALGSELTINENGEVDYKKAVDFMNKWDVPTGAWWKDFFKECNRVLKNGGYLLMFGMDRQLLLFKYYGALSGLKERQSLYWYYISSFPKSTDLSKMIDKRLGVERDVIGTGVSGSADTHTRTLKTKTIDGGDTFGDEYNVTKSNSDLGKKYEGYKYSIAPLKQTNETILVFQKDFKTGSCMKDTLLYENGDTETCCGAVNVDGCRVPFENTPNPATNPKYRLEGGYKTPAKGQESLGTTNFTSSKNEINLEGRYPSQTFVDSETANILDEQSGLSKSTGGRIGNKGSDLNMCGDNYEKGNPGYGDVAGCSKILHKCDFEKDEHELYFYAPKVSKSERNAGLEGFEEKRMTSDEVMKDRLGSDWENIDRPHIRPSKRANHHPTVKPIKLNERILKLFKTPNEQWILYPFAGSGSEIIGGIKAGFNNWIGVELNEEFIKIAEARIDYWSVKK